MKYTTYQPTNYQKFVIKNFHVPVQYTALKNQPKNEIDKITN